MNTYINLSASCKWMLGCSDGVFEKPEEYAEAWIPSDVQLVWKKFKDMPDWNFGKNYLEYKWMEDKYWHYTFEFELSDNPGLVPFLKFKGIDYRYTVTINGDVKADGEGMFTPVVIDLADYAGKKVSCEVVIHPIPKIPGCPDDRSQAAMSCKPAVSYGWDWHPRLVPSGIYDDVELMWLPKLHIKESDFNYELSDDFKTANFTAKIATSCGAGKLAVKIIDKDNNVTAEAKADIAENGHTELALTVGNPELWWCVNQGEQNLYTFETVLYDAAGNELEQKSRRFGFRRVKLLMNANDWSNDGFPQTQARYPITMELNGRRIFCKGTNFVPTEIFYSLMDKENYKSRLDCVLECNMNIIRMWGGGLVNKEPFFELCDEMGIMVWQEFPLSCNNYPDDKHYLSVLDVESVSIIKRLKSHPSVVMWCGGNELFNSWSGMTNQSLALRLLDKNCYENDPYTPFIMTSPLYGMGHGCYLSLTMHDLSRECLTDFVEKYRTAYTEFGVPSPAPFDYIKQYCPEDELYRIEDDTCWLDHHAINAWCEHDTWLRPKEIEGFYGSIDSQEKLFECGLELQGESYKGMFEECRRKWPRTSMALNWCFNEPWPCFANNSLILYPVIKRPAYYQVKEALRDQMLSLKLSKLRWNKGERVKTELYVLNDLPIELTGSEYKVYIIYGNDMGKNILDYNNIDESSYALIEIGEGRFDTVSPVTSKKLAEFEFTVPESADGKALLCVKAADSRLDSRYIIYTL